MSTSLRAEAFLALCLWATDICLCHIVTHIQRFIRLEAPLALD